MYNDILQKVLFLWAIDRNVWIEKHQFCRSFGSVECSSSSELNGNKTNISRITMMNHWITFRRSKVITFFKKFYTHKEKWRSIFTPTVAGAITLQSVTCYSDRRVKKHITPIFAPLALTLIAIKYNTHVYQCETDKRASSANIGVMCLFTPTL